jgi:hypothetical protein
MFSHRCCRITCLGMSLHTYVCYVLTQMLPDNLSWDVDKKGHNTGKVWVAGSQRWKYDATAGRPWIRRVMAKALKPEQLLVTPL